MKLGKPQKPKGNYNKLKLLSYVKHSYLDIILIKESQHAHI